MKKYIFDYNGSKTSREMRNFLNEKNIDYTIIHKNSDSMSRIFIEGENFSYKEKDFGTLKSRLIDELQKDMLVGK